MKSEARLIIELRDEAGDVISSAATTHQDVRQIGFEIGRLMKLLNSEASIRRVLIDIDLSKLSAPSRRDLF